MQQDTPGAALALIQDADKELRSGGHYEWYGQFDDLDPFTAPREQVEELRHSAPTPFAKGYLMGILAVRQQPAPAPEALPPISAERLDEIVKEHSSPVRQYSDDDRTVQVCTDPASLVRAVLAEAGRSISEDASNG